MEESEPGPSIACRDQLKIVEPEHPVTRGLWAKGDFADGKTGQVKVKTGRREINMIKKFKRLTSSWKERAH